MDSFKEIEVEKAKELIDQGGVTVVDIRNEDVYEEAHIAHAILVNDHNIEEFVKTADKNKPLICYCYHGFSSQSAAAYFIENGFQEVYSMIGGFEGWRAEFLNV